jgi:hypothetical protein
MRHLPALALLLGSFLALPSCSSDDGGATPSGTGGAGGGTGGAGGSAGGAGVGGTASCTATFTWLQKDAYKETAGRSSDLWPPHTTTAREVTCGGAVVKSSFRENHGTKPGDKDATGTEFLVPVGSMQADATWAELESLISAYEGCECGTSFLSMDALGDAAVQKLVAEVKAYVLAHLTCSGAVDAAGLVQKLEAGDIAGVIAVLPSCTWESGFDWSTGFDSALEKIIAAAKETLADYHVCNNDAELQAALFDGFRTSKTVTACDGAGALCHGPKWFYTPKP